MRPRKTDKIGATRHQDRVHMIGLVDFADRERGDARLVANAVGKRRLEHTAINGPGARRRLAGRHVDKVDAGFSQYSGNLDGILRPYTFRAYPVMRRDSHRYRLVVRPYLAHGTKHFDRKAHAILERAAIFIGPTIDKR